MIFTIFMIALIYHCVNECISEEKMIETWCDKHDLSSQSD
jgi:hypothetical protein